MTDTISPKRRSEIMSNIRSKGMKPEMLVRRLTHSMGFRYRLHRKDLPGKPDLVFPGRRKVIFVHGCFWHRHADPVCKLTHVPQSNRDYWLPKLERNASLDASHQAELSDLGWDVLTIWECEIREYDLLRERLRDFLGSR